MKDLKNEDFVVNIPMCVYNQEQFISQSIEGILNQKTNFNYILIIGEDCSSDGSREIIQNYLNKFPEKLKVIFHPKNVGAQENSRILFNECKGKYIALCDGDDYWCDPYKLQKQVDFLEANEDYAICFHRVYELAKGKDPELSVLYTFLKQETFTIEDLAKSNFIHTASVIFRNQLIYGLPDWFKDCPVGDYVLHMLNAEHGKIKYLPEAMAVYRSDIGIWSSQNTSIKLRNWIKVLNILIDYFDNPKILENLVNQQIEAYMYLNSQNDPVFLGKNYLVHKRLIEMLHEKDVNLSEISKNASLLVKYVSGKGLMKALFNKIQIKFFNLK